MARAKTNNGSVEDIYSQRPVTSAEFHAHTVEDNVWFTEIAASHKRFEAKFDDFVVRVEPYLAGSEATRLGLRGLGWLAGLAAAIGTAIFYISQIHK